ncbi:MAG TPA: EAL domain-containing protein, partial [Longimicrobiaceae bacterium]|nr:EAL domain-containing protein [Longimicrobiaceae bacterium]
KAFAEHVSLAITDANTLEAMNQAFHDSLTGLASRALFLTRMESAFASATDGVAALFVDLDRFKVVNDSLGHHVGDELLVAVAARLRSCVRATDLVARFGGDEFALLLDEVRELRDATLVAERIANAVSAPVNLNGYEVFTSASIGIVLSSGEARERPEYLLRNADMAMYRAKGSGVARYEVFDRAMHAQALARLQMETDLRRALARQEFRLVYQPIVSLVTGQVAGVEALIRWQHPERGLIAPAEFIPVAEETGAIVPLGEWVLGEACRQLAAWHADFRDSDLAVSVNLSAKQFHQRDLVERVSAVLAETGLEARHLKLEITESAIMDGAGHAGATLAALEALGVEMQLDDFGTGYSSLSCLHSLPMKALKVDRSFVSRMEAENATLQLVRTIAVMARGLGLAVIAEGVETEAQLAAVRAIGCDFAQGYLVSPPADPATLRRLLADGARW